MTGDENRTPPGGWPTVAAPAGVGGPRRFWARRLSERAPIFLAHAVPAAPLGPASIVGTRLGNRPAWSLAIPSWTVESPRVLASVVTAYRRHDEAYPRHRVLFLCNTVREVLSLQAHGVPAIFCHQNILVRDSVFTIDAAQTKAFDAIYVGQMSPYKRHGLARAVDSLAVIYYHWNAGIPGYLESVRAALPHAVFVNEEWARSGGKRLVHTRAQALAARLLAERRYAVVPQEVVVASCNRARVGLCLSDEEGAMYASMEYLLCGLPVVTTASRGGRDFFFDPEFTVTVAADATAVRDGVAALIERAIPPEHIRAATLRRIAHERARLRGFLAALFAEEGVGDEFSARWAELFSGPIWPWHTAESLLDGTDADRPSVRSPAARG